MASDAKAQYLTQNNISLYQDVTNSSMCSGIMLKNNDFSSIRAASVLGPPHYQGSIIILRHTTLLGNTLLYNDQPYTQTSS
jgi:hypothetical protein